MKPPALVKLSECETYVQLPGEDEEEPKSPVRLAMNVQNLSRWSLKEHAHEAYVWLSDHVGKREFALLLAGSVLAVLVCTHLDEFGSLWHACVSLCARLGAFAAVPIAIGCIVSTVAGIPVDFFLVWAGAFFESLSGQSMVRCSQLLRAVAESIQAASWLSCSAERCCDPGSRNTWMAFRCCTPSTQS